MSGEAIQQLRARIETDDFASGSGGYSRTDIARPTSQRIAGDVKLARPMQDRRRLRQRRAGRLRAGAVPPPRLRRARAVLRGGRQFPQPPSRSVAAREPRGPDARAGQRRRGTGPGLRRRRRPPGRGHQGGQDHLSRPPADAVRRRRAVAQPGRADHLRREVHAQPVPLDPRARRRAGAVEDRPLADQGEDEGDRRAAGRRDERPHVLQGALVRLRRRAVRRRAPAREPERAPDIDAEFARLPDSVNTPELQIKLQGRRELRADRPAAEDARASRARAR